MDRLPSELSGGMRKRAALARALALDPDILFFDEPSAGLDPITSADIDRLLIQLRKTFDVTLVVVTHEMSSAFNIADRLAMIHRGRVLVVDTPDRVRQSTNPIVQQFLNREPHETHGSAEKFKQFLDELED